MADIKDVIRLMVEEATLIEEDKDRFIEKYPSINWITVRKK